MQVFDFAALVHYAVAVLQESLSPHARLDCSGKDCDDNCFVVPVDLTDC